MKKNNLLLFLILLVLPGFLRGENLTTKPTNDQPGIVFSNEAIPEGDLEQSKLITTYKAGDKLFMRANLGKSLSERHAALVPKSKMKQIGAKFTYYINGNEAYSNIHTYHSSKAISPIIGVVTVAQENEKTIMLSKKNLSYSLIGEDYNRDEETEKDIARVFAINTPASNLKLKITIELYDLKQKKVLESICEGELNVVVNNVKDWESNKAIYAYIPKDPDLEKKMLKAAQIYAKSHYWTETFHKAVVIDPDSWSVSHNTETGAILGQNILALVYGKYSDGHCSIVNIVFRRGYAGNGQYENDVTMIWFTADAYDEYSIKNIPCECIGK